MPMQQKLTPPGLLFIAILRKKLKRIQRKSSPRGLKNLSDECMEISNYRESTVKNPAGKIAEKPVWRSVFLTKWHCILNADSTKTHSSGVTF